MSFPEFAGYLVYKNIYYGIPYSFNDNGPMSYFFDLYPEKYKKITNLINNTSTYWQDTEEIYTIINNEFILKDYLVNTGGFAFKSVMNIIVNKSVKNIIHSLVNKKGFILKMNWYNGLLEGFVHLDEYNNDMVEILLVQIEKGKVIKDVLMNKKEYDEFYEKWHKSYESSDEYRLTMRTEEYKNNLLRKNPWILELIKDDNFEEVYERILQRLFYKYEIGSKYIPEPFIRSTNGA